MKGIHAGLLAAGTALAGGLAVWMTAPPPMPVSVVTPATTPVKIVEAPAPVPQPLKPSPAPLPAPRPSPVVASAPAPVYSEPVSTLRPAAPDSMPKNAGNRLLMGLRKNSGDRMPDAKRFCVLLFRDGLTWAYEACHYRARGKA
jgi:hypothetical protein